MATDDYVYKGYFIPKGTLVLGNAWYATKSSRDFLRMLNNITLKFRAILHDERVFENHEEYRPERYLKDGKLDLSVRQPEVSVFGFGRRYITTLPAKTCTTRS